MTEGTRAPVVHWKSVALPVEHGGWGLLIEPMLLGMLVTPSWAGLWICLSALGVFLIHQPLKIAIKDHLKGRHYARTIGFQEIGFGLVYAVLGAVGIPPHLLLNLFN